MVKGVSEQPNVSQICVNLTYFGEEAVGFEVL